jgi:hypothetical protein
MCSPSGLRAFPRITEAVGPEDTAAMTAAFEEALKRLNIADHEAP